MEAREQHNDVNVIIMICRPLLLLFILLPSRDDANVHTVLLRTHASVAKKATSPTLSDSRSLCDLRCNEISAMDGLAHPPKFYPRG